MHFDRLHSRVADPDTICSGRCVPAGRNFTDLTAGLAICVRVTGHCETSEATVSREIG